MSARERRLPQLAYYTDDVRSLDPILGPRGWSCTVGIGADGSSNVDIFPTADGKVRQQAVSAQSPGACVGCLYGTICALLPGPAEALGYTATCPEKLNAAEQVHFAQGSALDKKGGRDTVEFEDPVGVKGSGSPSGGTNPANGVLLYDPDSYNPAGSSETCTLPDNQHGLCTAILNDFIAESWLVP